MKNKRMGEPAKPHLSQGTVLSDLGFKPSEALEIRVKAEIYRELLAYIEEQGLQQQELVAALGIHQPDVSNLLHGKISKFSVGKLIKFAGRLDLGVRVEISKPQARPSQRSTVQVKRRKLKTSMV